MDEGIGKTVMLFLLWLGLFFAPPIMGQSQGASLRAMQTMKLAYSRRQPLFARLLPLVVWKILSKSQL